jgi:UTP--glucose-1-phosphate uridylyltransferase
MVMAGMSMTEYAWNEKQSRKNPALFFLSEEDDMSKRIRKAVFPAGGLGTRFLPATKVIPKEMLALVDKPIIQYGVEEAVASGIEHIIIVTGRGKGSIEDHFDHSFELDATLERRGKDELLAVSRGVSSLAKVSYIRQKEPLGLGHAVLCAKDLVGDEPFAVILPDDVIDSVVPCLKQMIGVFEERGGSVLATQTVEGPGISAYGVLAGSQDPTNARVYNCTGMVEKPNFKDAPSKQAIIGRYVLTPRIFELLAQTTPGAGGEIQLTDAILALLKEEKVFGYTFEGKRYDAGDKFGMLQATVEFALKRPDLGPEFREYLKKLAL